MIFFFSMVTLEHLILGGTVPFAEQKKRFLGLNDALLTPNFCHHKHKSPKAGANMAFHCRLAEMLRSLCFIISTSPGSNPVKIIHECCFKTLWIPDVSAVTD